MSTAPRSLARRLATAVAVPAALTLALVAGGGAAASSYYGSVAVIDADAGSEVMVDGQPQVCSFWLEFDLNFAADVVGWEIREWSESPPDGALVLDGQGGPTDADGRLRQPVSGALTLPEGRYNVLWDDEPVDASFDSRSFVVDCPEAVPPTPSESASASPSDEGTGGTQPTPSDEDLAAGGGGAAITPPPTDTVAATEGSADVGVVALILSILAALTVIFSMSAQRVLERTTRRYRG